MAVVIVFGALSSEAVEIYALSVFKLETFIYYMVSSTCK